MCTCQIYGIIHKEPFSLFLVRNGGRFKPLISQINL
jgi:hypothetical protein